ncbi:hypothetical protein ACFPFV_12780 [Salinicoccus siamensis]|uniref:hypothetical protein n=1 Tax=Salinicoccus siamensis TaxID=381830 RepID=UPI003618B5C9
MFALIKQTNDVYQSKKVAANLITSPRFSLIEMLINLWVQLLLYFICPEHTLIIIFYIFTVP